MSRRTPNEKEVRYWTRGEFADSAMPAEVSLMFDLNDYYIYLNVETSPLPASIHTFTFARLFPHIHTEFVFYNFYLL